MRCWRGYLYTERLEYCLVVFFSNILASNPIDCVIFNYHVASEVFKLIIYSSI